MSGRELSCEGFQQAKERGTVLGRGKAGISSADCVTFTKKTPTLVNNQSLWPY
jgi:hypothetical protein